MNRFRAALAVAATAAAAVAITPASAHPRTPVAAAGQTVVRAAQTGYVDLSLPDDVRVSTRTADNPDLDVSGPGRLVGFWLYRLDTTVDSLLAVRLAGPAGARVWSAVTTSTPEHGPCTKWPNDTVPAEQGCAPAPTATLHHGRYRLVVFTDGAPVTVKLRLHGLRGRRGVSRLTPSAGGVADMTALPNPTGQLARARATVTPGETGMVISAVNAKWGANPNVAGSYACYYDANNPLGDQMLPHCPGGSGGGGDSLDPQHKLSGTFSSPSLAWQSQVGPGSYTVGQALVDDNGVSIVNGVAAWFAVPGSLVSQG